MLVVVAVFAGAHIEHMCPSLTHTVGLDHSTARFHNDSFQSAWIERNIFDQQATSSAGVGRAVPIFNNVTINSKTPYPYINIARAVQNMTFQSNVFSCATATATASGIGSSIGSGSNVDVGGHSDECKSNFLNGQSFSQWQGSGPTGEDAGSASGSPGFALGPDTLRIRRDYRILTNRSAAVQTVGFVPLDLTLPGPRNDKLVGMASCHNNGGDSATWWEGCTIHLTQ
jgi:hypothetical protein